MNALFEECERMFVTPEIQKQVDMLVDIANRIYEILDEKNMSQKDLAKIIGKTEAEVSRWLSGTHNITIATLAKVSVALGEDVIITTKNFPSAKTITYHCSNVQTMDYEYDNDLQRIYPLRLAS